MIDIIHSALACINHWRENRRVRRACRMTVAQLETFYEYFTANGGFSRIGETSNDNKGDIRAARPVPGQLTLNNPTN